MTRTLTSSAIALAFILGIVPAARAQEKPGMVPLKLDLVIVRQAGEKKISSMPYTMWLTANAPEKMPIGAGGGTSLRMGVRVPVPVTVVQSKEGAAEPVRSFTYQNVGTNIDATAMPASDGRFGIGITLNDSGLSSRTEKELTGGAPLIREFTSRFFILLRDGQTATYTSATDPVTGETLKVDVTLTVLK